MKARDDRAWSAHFFDHGKGQDHPGVRGTLWAAYNGVTEFIDHCLPPNGGKRRRTSSPQSTATPTNDRRLESVWFGSGYRAKARAYQVAKQWLTAAPTN
jgi:hypothetical protein